MKQCLEINNGKHSGGVKYCHVQEKRMAVASKRSQNSLV